MGWAIVIGDCINCCRTFGFNPLSVPSIRVNAKGEPDPDGIREPLCESCMGILNARRVAAGLEPLTYPANAYQPIEENGLP